MIRDLENLSQAFTIWIGDCNDFVVVADLRLPHGFNRPTTDLLIELPPGYPVAPPGVGCHIYVHPNLRLHGRGLTDLHSRSTPSFATPGFGPWAWLCYERIEWCPERDDLIKFVEMVRADLSQAKTESAWSLL
jgi:hypothetical protein